MPDDKKPGPVGPMQTRKFVLPPRPKPEETRYFSGEGVADLTLARVKSARLSEEELKSLQGKGEAKIPQAKNVLRGAKEEENRLSRHTRDDEGKIIDVDRIRDTLISVTEYVSSAKFDHPEGGNGPFHLSVFILYCGHPVNRRFLLSNAPLSILGVLEKASETEAKFYNCITGRCSITLGGEPGSPRYIYLATKEIEDVMSAICSRYPATQSVLTSIEEMRRASGSAPEIDLPAAVAKPQEDPFGFSPKRPSLRVRKEDTAPSGVGLPAISGEKPQEPEFLRGTSPFPARSGDALEKLHDSIGLKFEDLRKPRQVDNPRARELFGGYEVVLTQPGVEGMRLIVTTKFPSSLVDLGAEQIGYIDPTKWKEVITRKGHRVFYILVKHKAGRPARFSLDRLDDSCQILGGDEDSVPKPASAPEVEGPEPEKEAKRPVPEVKKAPEPAREEKAAEKAEEMPAVLMMTERAARDETVSQEPSRPPSIPPGAAKLLDEVHAAVREHARDMGKGASEAPEEVIFGDSIAVLTKIGPRHYLITDGEWNEARAGMEAHLSSPGNSVMLTEVMSGFGKKFIRLESGDRITITTRPVGKSTKAAYGDGRSHSDTLEMIPPEVLASAGVPPSRKPAAPAQEKGPIAQAEAGKDPDGMEQRRKALTANLLRSASLYIPESYLLDEESERMIDEKSRLLIGIPEILASARAVEAFGGWYIWLRTVEGTEYALFRFPSAPSGVSNDLLSMPAATIFTSRLQDDPRREFSYIIIETRFLAPSLTEMMLRHWARD